MTFAADRVSQFGVSRRGQILHMRNRLLKLLFETENDCW